MKKNSLVLIVDDQPQNLELMEAYLIPEGYDVVSAINGEEALAKLACNMIDLMLLDVMMPGMDGFEVISWVRKDPAHNQLPIILVTALQETEHRVKGIEAGCDDFLSKPIEKAELLARVRSLLKIKAYNDLMANYRNKLENDVAIRTEELRKMADALAESNAAMRRFVPEQFLKQLGKSSIEHVKLGDHIAIDMTIMFADIRGFTTIAEMMTAEETFGFINEYMSRLGPPVRAHGGFIDKFIGDGIMALFPTSSESALRCAIEMHTRLADFNIHLARSMQAPIKIGIGLHEGRLMLGTVGEEERMDGTVISDSVNTASRIEGLSKQFGIGVAVSSRVINSLEDTSRYRMRYIGKVDVRGRREAVSIFEAYDGDPEPLRIKKDSIKIPFERGVETFYSKDYKSAMESFREVLAEFPDDQVSSHYVRIIRRLLT